MNIVGQQINLITNVTAGTCASWDWTVTGGTYTANTVTNASSFGFTPTQTGNYTVVATCGYGGSCEVIDTFNLVVEAQCALSAAINSSNVTCNGGSNGSATVSVTGGSGSYIYAWSTNSNAPSISNLTAGTYSVTVTDQADSTCRTTRSVSISQPNAIAITCNGTAETSAGASNGTASVNASGGSGGLTYSWSNGSTATSISGLSPGTYTVTVRDSNGCQKACSYVVTAGSCPTISINLNGNNVSCNGGSTGSITTTGTSGGTTPYNWTWAGPQGYTGSGPIITGLIAGTYSASLTDANGCPATDTITITEPAVISLSTGFSNATCTASNGSASVNASGGTPGYFYTWTNSSGTTVSTSSTASNLPAGTYTILVQDGFSCSAQSTVTIGQTNTTLNATCSGTNELVVNANDGTASVSVSNGTAPYTYLWTGTSSSFTTQNISGLADDTYTVVVTDANGCTGTCSYTVQAGSPAVQTGGCCSGTACTDGVNEASCNNIGGLWLGAGVACQGTSLCANFGACCFTSGSCNLTSQTTCSNVGGTWKGAGTACTASICQPCNLTATESITDDVCANNTGSITISPSGGTAPYFYTWSGSAAIPNTANATNLPAGTYNVTVTDSNSCTFDINNMVVQANPNGPLQITLISQTNGAFTQIVIEASGGTAAYNGVWTHPDGSTTNTSGVTQTVTNLCNGVHSLTVTDANGCTRNQSYTITTTNC